MKTLPTLLYTHRMWLILIIELLIREATHDTARFHHPVMMASLIGAVNLNNSDSSLSVQTLIERENRKNNFTRLICTESSFYFISFTDCKLIGRSMAQGHASQFMFDRILI